MQEWITKGEHIHVIEKGLTHALKFPRVFRVEWIKDHFKTNP